MKILVLSCSTGEGHNSAAKAVCEALNNMGAECELVDPVSFKGEKTPKTIAKLYNDLIKKTPRAFGVVYKIGDLYDSSPLPSPIYAWNAAYAEKLNKYIIDGGFDAVVSTHLYGMEALTAIRRANKQTVPFYGVITDYTIIPFTRETDLDEYFIPHAELKNVFRLKGVNEDKLNATGIPVSPSIREEIDISETRKNLGLPTDKKIILLMSGGVGCESIKPLLRRFKKNYNDDHFYCVLVGNNKNLKEKIEKNFPSDKVKAVGFTDKVRLYLKCSDVVISKSGGLSSTEVAVANIPLVHFKPIPGCETYNAKFFSEKGLSKLAKNGADAIRLADELLANENERKAMVNAQREEINAFSADDVARRIIECRSVNV